MLYALGQPYSLVSLLLSFLVAITVHGVAQSVLAARLGDRTPAVAGRSRPEPRPHVDPFGAIAAAIAGVGWAKEIPADPRRLRSRGRWTAVLLAGPAANLLLGLAALVGFVAVGGSSALLEVVGPAGALQGDADGLPFGQTFLLLLGLSNLVLALLSLVPIPPLEGGRLMFAYAPRTSGWQKAEYYLAEQNWGIGLLLVLLLLPLVGRLPLLLGILDVIASPVVGGLGGLL